MYFVRTDPKVTKTEYAYKFFREDFSGKEGVYIRTGTLKNVTSVLIYGFPEILGISKLIFMH